MFNSKPIRERAPKVRRGTNPWTEFVINVCVASANLALIIRSAFSEDFLGHVGLFFLSKTALFLSASNRRPLPDSRKILCDARILCKRLSDRDYSRKTLAKSLAGQDR